METDVQKVGGAQCEWLANVDFRLFFLGEVSYGDISGKFDVGLAVALRDRARCRAFISNNISFFGSSKTYRIPLALVGNALCWHVWAYVRRTSSFLDFVLTRVRPICVVSSRSPFEEPAAHDLQRSRKMEIVPHPDFPHSELAAFDYSMTDGVLRICNKQDRSLGLRPAPMKCRLLRRALFQRPRVSALAEESQDAGIREQHVHHAWQYLREAFRWIVS